MPTHDEITAALKRLARRKAGESLANIYGAWGSNGDTDRRTLADAYPALLADRNRLAKACAETEHEVQQILGAALGYPRYADDPATFPDATDADGVFVGENVAATLAMEMVAERDRLAGQLAKCHRMLRYVYNGCATPLGSYEVKNLLVSHGILPEESP